MDQRAGGVGENLRYRAQGTRRGRKTGAAEGTMPEERKATDYKSDVKPIWCAGCGNYAVSPP